MIAVQFDPSPLGRNRVVAFVRDSECKNQACCVLNFFFQRQPTAGAGSFACRPSSQGSASFIPHNCLGSVLTTRNMWRTGQCCGFNACKQQVAVREAFTMLRHDARHNLRIRSAQDLPQGPVRYACYAWIGCGRSLLSEHSSSNANTSKPTRSACLLSMARNRVIAATEAHQRPSSPPATKEP